MNGPDAVPNRAGHIATRKFVVNYLKYDQTIRNVSTQDLDLTLYDVVLRNGVDPNIELGQDPVTVWDNGLNLESGPSRQPGANYGNYTVNSPGTTPFHSQAFCKMFKIKKVTKKTLSAGEVHHHLVTVRPRNMFDGQGTQAIPAPSVYSRGIYTPGLSGFTMIVGKGSLVNSATVKMSVTYSKPAVDVISLCTGSFSSFSKDRKFHYAYDGLDNTKIDYQGVQDDAGLIRPDEAA